MLLRLVICKFELATREFELVTSGFELVTQAELVTHKSVLVIGIHELVTRLLLFNLSYCIYSVMHKSTLLSYFIESL